MTRAVNLETTEAYSRRGLTDGEWVHSVERIVVPWFGPTWFWNNIRGEMSSGEGNCHFVEGKLVLGPTWAFLETTLWVKQEVILGRRFGGHTLTIDARRHLHVLRPGPLPDECKRRVDLGTPQERRRRGRRLSEIGDTDAILKAHLGPEPPLPRVPRATNLASQ